MNLESLIRSVLYEEGKVSVSGLGTFSLQYQPARLVKTEQIDFNPPQRNVVFSTECTKDLILTSAVSRAAKCSQDEALKKISLFSLKVKNEVKKNGSFSLEGVGTLHEDGTFVSLLLPDSFPETFGLKGFSIQKISEVEKKKPELENKSFNGVAGVVKTLFLASPILFGAMLIPSILQVSQNADFASMFRKTEVSVDFVEPEMPRPHTFKPSVNNSENSSLVTETVSVSENAGTIESVETEYYVIAGTFSDIANAERYVKRLKAEKYNAGIIKGEKNKVYLAAFERKEDAVHFVDNLQKGQVFKKAWIFHKKS
ncbi:MAG: SPOR domain-containing protein [Bacteroidales bacterium]|nr:SPOR domain-containing protein [Bacteroidales bacterium]